MPNRREFLGALTVPVAAACSNAGWKRDSLARVESASRTVSSDPLAAAQDEDFWAEIAQAFTVDRSLINFNNGGVSPSPRWVQEAQKGHLDFSNHAPTYTMWRILEPQRETVRARIAREWGVSPEECALTRNASESLQICQFGFDLAPGDVVLTTTQDYPRMLTTFEQRVRREGIVLEKFPVPVPSEDDDAFVAAFEERIRTLRPKLVLVCHVINLTGQILPVDRIAALGRQYGVPVIVDGAHALAHFDFKLADLDVDYYAVSLHKWLMAPHGTGLLYVKRDKIGDLWPLMAAAENQRDDIRKFEEIGTHPAAGYLAIGEALTFHQLIGGARKEARLRYLRDTWAKALLEHDRIRLHTSLDPRFSCGIGTVEIDGVAPNQLVSHLFKAHRIIVTGIHHDEVKGIRVSPSIYSTHEELGRFVDAMLEVADHGIPA